MRLPCHDMALGARRHHDAGFGERDLHLAPRASAYACSTLPYVYYNNTIISISLSLYPYTYTYVHTYIHVYIYTLCAITFITYIIVLFYWPRACCGLCRGSGPRGRACGCPGPPGGISLFFCCKFRARWRVPTWKPTNHTTSRTTSVLLAAVLLRGHFCYNCHYYYQSY